jgi:translation initiation factor 2 alpha subunit (eIF-2alpha)
MKTNERLRDYTNLFFENRNTCVDSYKKGIRDRKIFEKIHELGATTVATLMEVVNKLIDTYEALVNQFDCEASATQGPLALRPTQAPSFANGS